MAEITHKPFIRKTNGIEDEETQLRLTLNGSP